MGGVSSKVTITLDEQKSTAATSEDTITQLKRIEENCNGEPIPPIDGTVTADEQDNGNFSVDLTVPATDETVKPTKTQIKITAPFRSLLTRKKANAKEPSADASQPVYSAAECAKAKETNGKSTEGDAKAQPEEVPCNEQNVAASDSQRNIKSTFKSLLTRKKANAKKSSPDASESAHPTVECIKAKEMNGKLTEEDAKALSEEVPKNEQNVAATEESNKSVEPVTLILNGCHEPNNEAALEKVRKAVDKDDKSEDVLLNKHTVELADLGIDPMGHGHLSNGVGAHDDGESATA